MKTDFLKKYLTLALLLSLTTLVMAQPGNPNPPAAPFPIWALLALGGTALGLKILYNKEK